MDQGKTDGPTGYFGSRLEDAVNGYQKDGGLKVDGHLNPKGETIGALKNVDVNKEKAGNQMSFWKSPGKRTIKWTKGLKFQVPKIKMKLRVMNGLGGLSREKIRFDLAAIDAKW
ncbi:MAG: peptidoglycan-binding protein [Rhodospirillales bacterium]|nr:peptidoglycan-binding protein [Rhodospirillales bacterium]